MKTLDQQGALDGSLENSEAYANHAGINVIVDSILNGGENCDELRGELRRKIKMHTSDVEEGEIFKYAKANIENNDIKKLALLLENIEDKQIKQALAEALIDEAVFFENVEAAELLIRHEALADREAAEELFLYALDNRKNKKMVELLFGKVQFGKITDINKHRGPYETTILIDVVRGEYDDIVEPILREGADVNAVDKENRTAIMHAAGRKNKKHNVVDILLKYDADVSILDRNGDSAEDIAKSEALDLDKNTCDMSIAEKIVRAKHEQLRERKKLADHNADLMRQAEQARKLLACALKLGGKEHILLCIKEIVISGSVEDLEMLLESIEDKEVKREYLNLAFVYSAKWKKGDIVKQLSQMEGVDINAKDEKGMTALMHTADNGDYDTCVFLLGIEGIEIDAVDSGGWTAFLRAAWRQNSRIESLLREKGANVDIKDKYGRDAECLRNGGIIPKN